MLGGAHNFIFIVKFILLFLSFTYLIMSTAQESLFSADVIDAVRQTWAKLNATDNAVGQAIFRKLFEVHPDYQSYFPKMKDVPYKDLPTSKGFLHHSATIQKELNFAVNTLEDPDTLVNRFLAVGKKHVKYNLTEEQYRNVQNVIEITLKDTLQNEYNESVSNAWNEVLTAAIGIIIKGDSS